MRRSPELRGITNRHWSVILFDPEKRNPPATGSPSKQEFAGGREILPIDEARLCSESRASFD